MQFQRVLFVDDNIVCNIELSDALRRLGCQVISVFCAQAALEIIDRREYVTALVTDVDLGPGIDGFALARQARVAYPMLPVVIISGSAAARHDAEGVQGSIFISKPLRCWQVVDALELIAPREAA